MTTKNKKLWAVNIITANPSPLTVPRVIVPRPMTTLEIKMYINYLAYNYPDCRGVKAHLISPEVANTLQNKGVYDE